jgi:TolA-binding protein
MDNIEEQILSYPHLSPERQEAVEAYVEAHPEWAPLLRDVRSFESLLGGLPARTAGPDGDPLLATYVVARHVGLPAPSEALDDAFSRLETALDGDPDLRARADAMRDRLVAAETELDPVAHFESLTSHALTPETAAESAPAAAETASSRRSTPGALAEFVDHLLGLPRAVRGVGAALVLLLGAYLTLFVASTATQSPLTRLARVEVSDQMVESYYSANTRSLAPAADTLTADALYLQSLSTLQHARSSTLGLFPAYDADSLQQAETGLKQVLARTDAGSFLGLEAQFYLGKIHLAQKQVEAARTRFRTVVEQDGRRADEARRLLRELDEATPAGTS